MEHGATRQQLIEAADDLFARQGFDNTSFADIAKAVNISRGNLYHHFKAKNDILDAVIQARMAKSKHAMAQWESEGPTPSARIIVFLDNLLAKSDALQERGCPNGTLCTELSKLKHKATNDSVEVLALYRQWLKNQFSEMQTLDDPEELAMQTLSWSQGVSTTTNAFKDHAYLEREVTKMKSWVLTLPTSESSTE